MAVDPTAAAADAAKLEMFKALVTAGGVVVGAAIAALVGTIGAALITRSHQRERNRQDQEAQWRTHAVELTKLDFERLKRAAGADGRMLPVILSFLPLYRDLRELNTTSPADLYTTILNKRMGARSKQPALVASDRRHAVISCAGFQPEGHPRVFFEVGPDEPTPCPYCSREYIIPEGLKT